MPNWETRLREWSKPVNDDQEARANYTAEQIRSALSNYSEVPNTMMKVRAQGSKLNNTDTSDESDVDIRVELFTEGGQDPDLPRIFFTKRAGLAKSLTRDQLGLEEAQLPLNQSTFKTHIERALDEKFGSHNVKRENKCIKVAESSLLFPADIVPCFPIRMYEDVDDFETGISIRCDDGQEVLNFPEQHYANGVAKNEATGRRFKRMVRCLKRMENLLVQEGQLTRALPSFFIESLVFNCPNQLFAPDTYADVFTGITFHLTTVLDNKSACDQMFEVNKVKNLFNDGQSWTALEGRTLALMAWHRVYTAT